MGTRVWWMQECEVHDLRDEGKLNFLLKSRGKVISLTYLFDFSDRLTTRSQAVCSFQHGIAHTESIHLLPLLLDQGLQLP